MHCVASRLGYPNYRLSELSLVSISSDNRRSTVYFYDLETPGNLTSRNGFYGTGTELKIHKTETLTGKLVRTGSITVTHFL